MRQPFPFDSMKMPRALLRRRCYLLAAGIFFLLMVVIGSIPGEANTLSSMVPDKLLHFTAYVFLSVMLYSGLNGDQTRRVLATVLLIGLLGALDETIQIFLPYRQAGIADWTFDMLAALVCVTVLTLLRNFVSRRRRAAPGFITTPTMRSPMD